MIEGSSGKLDWQQDPWYRIKKEKVMKIFKNDLTHYFIRPHNQLPQGYLASCEKFFKSIKQQASSGKLQASSIKKQLHKPGQRVKNRFNRKV